MDEEPLVYLLVILTTLVAFGYLSLTLRKLGNCVEGCKGAFKINILGIFITGASLVLWRVIFSPPVPGYVFQAGALVGVLLYVLSIVTFRAFRIKKELLLQIAAVFLPVLVVSLYAGQTSELGLLVFIAFFESIMLLALWWFLSVEMLTHFEKRNLRIASWLVVLFAWLRSYQLTRNGICLFYTALMVMFTSSVLLLYSAMVVYERASRWL
ncbi:hypothetical protein A3L09_06975 [Thermococcus profundus]|uniref:Uncharacterized protein n=1 Tax=Thermococcus profundus TaxID=49899 RepID=A0A2Z2MB46_THEPR|nr:hypothetical protein [Thermococcus profundus]ASJ03016.1 hypothetical protein A3L09_06975 [Thermococcus profundus]